MKAWIDLPLEEKRAIFSQAAIRMGLPPAAIEKDFWVIIALRAIFRTSISNSTVFKGGTSLSKAWGII
jgi:predicted nucleotidyltransferase component of viral defense system